MSVFRAYCAFMLDGNAVRVYNSIVYRIFSPDIFSIYAYVMIYDRGIKAMSVFSELLKTYTDRCGITVVSLAKQCGIDRTTLHKIISGERRPPNPEFVMKLSGLLMLSSPERDRLMEQYEISLVGDELYRRRRNVMEMIKKLSELASGAFREAENFYLEDPDAGKICSFYYSRQYVMRGLYSELTSELNKGASICIITQPDEQFLEFMKFASAYYKGSEIKHIFCLDNTAGEGGANDYNLGLLPRVFELSVLYSNYHPMYYYDNVESHINAASLLPIMAVGENFMFRAPYNYESGFIIRDKESVDFSVREFERIEAMCYPFIERANNVAGMFGKGSSYHDYSLTLEEHPSLMLVSEEAVIRKSMNFPKEQLERFIEQVKYLQDRYRGRDYMVVFSAGGLEKFMNTGIVKELTSNQCSPLPPEVRIKTLEKIIEKTSEGVYDFRIIEESAAPSERLRINLDTEGAVHFVLRKGADYVFMTADEQSLKIAMHDYFSHLLESGKIYDRERSLLIMREILAAAKNEFSSVSGD